MVLQCRGHLITEGMHPQYDLFKQWAAVKRPVLEERLEDRFILFGEWVYARHSVHYRQLPHYFFEFDIYDKESEELPEPGTAARPAGRDGHPNRAGAPRRGVGPGASSRHLIGPSRFDSQFENPLTKRTDNLMEGLVPANRGGRRRDRAGEVRPARVRREGQAERALAVPGHDAQSLERRGGHLVMTWNELCTGIA